MLNFQSDLKFIREALTILIDKLLPYIEQKQIHQFCKVLKNKVADEKITPFSIYMEAQKSFEGSQAKTTRFNNTSDQQFTQSVLNRLKQAQTEFKNNTQQFASIYNSVKENVESVYISNQELQIMMNEKQMYSKVESRQDKIRRVSVYNKQDKQNTDKDIQEEKLKEYNKDILTDSKQEIKSNSQVNQNMDLTLENTSDTRNNVKLDSKYSLEGKKKELCLAQEYVDNYWMIQQNESQPQIKNEKSVVQLSPQNYYQVKTQNITSQPSYNQVQIQTHSYMQVTQQNNSQSSNQNYAQQQFQCSGQILYTKSEQKLNSQIGSYVPNYDLLARVDQLLQRTKINNQSQSNTQYQINRI